MKNADKPIHPIDLIKLESPELAGVEKSKAQQIKATFEPMVKMLEDFEAAYNEVVSASKAGIDQDLTARAKRLRIDIGKVRIQTDKARLSGNEESQREIKARNGVAHLVTWAVTDKENKLKEIENYFEIQEQKRLEALQSERAELLSLYVEDAHERNLSGMEDDVWSAYLAAKEKEYLDRVEAERKAEAERIERQLIEELRWRRSEIIKPYYSFFKDDNSVKLGEISDKEFDKLLTDLKRKKIDYDAEQERISREIERLKKEAEKRERLAKIEADKRAKEEAARKAKEEKERLSREAEARKEREAYEAKLQAERQERERVQRELQAKQEAERKAQEDEAARIEAELSKGDAAKVKDLINDLGSLTSKYSFKSKKNKKMYVDVCQLIDKIINHIQK